MTTYTQPAVGQTVTIPVASHIFVPGLVIYHQNGGYYRVISTNPTSLTLENLGYNNPPPFTTIVHTGAVMLAAGEPGSQGATGASGAQGIQGPVGLQGETGDDGKDGVPLYGGSGSPFGCGTSRCGVDGRNLGIRVCIENHGFKVGDILRVSGNLSTEFVKADATTFEKSVALGIVQCVIDKNAFVLVTNGRVEFIDDELPTWAPDGLFQGQIYYLSNTPGELSIVPGSIVKAIFVGYEETVGFFNTYSAGGGSAGPAGLNAFTITEFNFTVPAINGTETIAVLNSQWMQPGQPIFISSAGYYEVQLTPTLQSVVIKNLGYTGNAAPGSTILAGVGVSPSGRIGLQGPAGATGASGNQGATGVAGATGVSGPSGATGPSGAVGTTGPVGPSGVAGPTGASGVQGASGATGPAGGEGFNFFIEAVANKTYTITQFAQGNSNMTYIVVKTAAGTCTAQFQRNGVNITGASAIAVTSTEQIVTINQAIVTGDTITMIISNNNLATDLAVVMGV
jgi:hypothetical protein